jgi:hypothetical protein
LVKFKYHESEPQARQDNFERMTRHTVSVAQVYSQKFGISKIKKEIGEPGQKILSEKRKKKGKS